jgi:hypothetical protein
LWEKVEDTATETKEDDKEEGIEELLGNLSISRRKKTSSASSTMIQVALLSYTWNRYRDKQKMATAEFAVPIYPREFFKLDIERKKSCLKMRQCIPPALFDKHCHKKAAKNSKSAIDVN